MPTDDTNNPVEFVGESGPGAAINQYLPQPGQHVGRRIIRIDDIPESYFLDGARTSGTPWAEYLGLEKENEIWGIQNPEILTSNWLGRYRAATGLDANVTARVSTALTVSARDSLAASGSLVTWARGTALKSGGSKRGRGAMARLSSAPDESGNTEPLPSDLPDVPDTLDEDPPLDDFFGSMTQLEHGLVNVFVPNWGESSTSTTVDVEAPPAPALFIVQVVGISSFLGDYGLGQTVKTFSLLPDEEYKYYSRTWRASEETMSKATSIIDSFDEKSSDRFAETVMNETTDTATREKTENWHVETGAKASIGIASASVSGGGGGEYSSSTEEFSKSLDEAVREHTSEASSHRENSVQSSSESSVSSGDEAVVERTIKNINLSRVLNFTIREAIQEHRVKTHLKDTKIGFSNGNAESWREEPVSGLRKLIQEFIKPEFVDKVCSEIISTIANARNVDDDPVPVLEQVRLNKCGTDFTVRKAEPNDDCLYPPPTENGRLYYRFKRGSLAQAADEEHPVDGVVLSDRTITLGSDSMLTEALLGQAVALDEDQQALQLEAIREKRLANERQELALRIVRGGKVDEATLYQGVFGVCCDPVVTDEEPVEV